MGNDQFDLSGKVAIVVGGTKGMERRSPSSSRRAGRGSR